MKILDPFKIREHRELVDEAVAQRCLATPISRPRAYGNILAEFKRLLLVTRGDGGWIAGTVVECEKSQRAVKLAELSFDPDDPDLVSKVSTQVDELCDSFLRATYLAHDVEFLQIAAILHELDPEIDLAMDAHDFRQFYGASDARAIFSCLPLKKLFFALGGGTSSFSIAKTLFEDDEEYLNRLVQQLMALRLFAVANKATGAGTGLLFGSEEEAA